MDRGEKLHTLTGGGGGGVRLETDLMGEEGSVLNHRFFSDPRAEEGQ